MEAAQAKVEEEYYNSEHILDSENFTGVDFSAEAEREIVQEQKEQLDVLLVKPGMYPQAVQIGGELEDLQKAVSGINIIFKNLFNQCRHGFQIVHPLSSFLLMVNPHPLRQIHHLLSNVSDD